jgi:hypothetical protein
MRSSAGQRGDVTIRVARKQLAELRTRGVCGCRPLTTEDKCTFEPILRRRIFGVDELPGRVGSSSAGNRACDLHALSDLGLNRPF